MSENSENVVVALTRFLSSYIINVSCVERCEGKEAKKMKWWKKLCAAALALSMPVLASAEAKLVDMQTFARSITLGRASDTYVTRED